MLSSHYGSLDSRFKHSKDGIITVPDGVAHFLEHKLFEEEDGNVFNRFAAWGASVNAFTSYSQTSYLFSTTDEWKKCLVELMNFVNRPYLTEENVEKEKGIIEQELQMYADQPDHRLHSTLLENLYQCNPVRIDIGGTVESVRATTVADLLKSYYSFYQPSNMALVLIGDVDPAESFDLIAKKYPTWEHPRTDLERFNPEEPKKAIKSWAEEQWDISRPRYLLGFKHEPIWQGTDLLRQQIIMSLVMRLIAGRSSKIHAELYERDLVDDSFGASFSGHLRYAHTVIGSETLDPEALHEELVLVINKLKTEKINDHDLSRLKRQMYGSHLSSYESFEYSANRMIAGYFNQTPFEIFLDLVREISAKEIQAVIQDQFNWDKSSVSILRPGDKHA